MDDLRALTGICILATIKDFREGKLLNEMSEAKGVNAWRFDPEITVFGTVPYLQMCKDIQD